MLPSHYRPLLPDGENGTYHCEIHGGTLRGHKLPIHPVFQCNNCHSSYPLTQLSASITVETIRFSTRLSVRKRSHGKQRIFLSSPVGGADSSILGSARCAGLSVPSGFNSIQRSVRRDGCTAGDYRFCCGSPSWTGRRREVGSPQSPHWLTE